MVFVLWSIFAVKSVWLLHGRARIYSQLLAPCSCPPSRLRGFRVNPGLESFHREVPGLRSADPTPCPPEAISRRGFPRIRPLANPISGSSRSVIRMSPFRVFGVFRGGPSQSRPVNRVVLALLSTLNLQLSTSLFPDIACPCFKAATDRSRRSPGRFAGAFPARRVPRRR